MDKKRIHKEIIILIRFLKEKHVLKQWVEKANGNRIQNYQLITNINSIINRLINNNEMNVIYNTNLVSNITKLEMMFFGTTAFNAWYAHPYTLGENANIELQLWKDIDSSYVSYRKTRKKLFELWAQKK